MVFSRRSMIWNGLLAGACLLGAAWRGAELRSESSVRHSEDDTRESNPLESVAPPTVAALMLQLTDPHPSIRREAIATLAEMGPAAEPAAEALQARLRDRDLFVRVEAARAGIRLGAPLETLLPVLSDLLLSENPQICGLAALALGDVGPAARGSLRVLQKRLASPSSLVRLHSAKAILMIETNHDEARHALLAGLRDEAAELRYFAVNALGLTAMQNKDVILALLRALTDSDTNVASAAGLNLLAFDNRADRLHVAVTEVSEEDSSPVGQTSWVTDLSHPSAIVRQTAAIRAAMAGSSASGASRALYARLKDENPAVRVYAAHALSKIERNGNDLLPVLIELLESEAPQVRVAAVFVLGRMRAGAQAALPLLRNLLAASELLDRLLVAAVITRIDPQSREAQAILIEGLYDPEVDVRYLSALALGRAPCRAVAVPETKETEDGQEERLSRDDDLPVETDEEPPGCVAQDDGKPDEDIAESDELPPAVPIAQPSKAPSTGIATLLAAAKARAVADALSHSDEPRLEDDRRDNRLALADDDFGTAARLPFPRENVRAAARDDVQPETEENTDDGLKRIGSLGASIRMSEGELPANRAAVRFAGVPAYYHGYGARRGWLPSGFGWEAPAVFFKPLYFEDINLERYGIHYGCLQPAVSFGHFFTRCVCLPYKLLVQPPCECIYTLGYERPNNCVPLYCYCRLGYPSYEKWCQQWTCPCPVRPACPWLPSEDGVCTDDDDCP